MKICSFCGTACPDDSTRCTSCGAQDFDFVCENCHTRFHSGYCPNCGVKAGERPRTCPGCGKTSFGIYCPDCGRRLDAQAYAYTPSAAASQKEKPLSSRSVTGMIVLTVFLPFVGAWIVLFDARYGRGLKIFALLYSAFFTAALFWQRSWAAGLICFAPIAGYGLNLAFDRVKKAKEH